MNQQTVPTAEIYTPATGAFTTVGNMNTPSMGHIAALLNNGKVLIAKRFESWRWGSCPDGTL